MNTETEKYFTILKDCFGQAYKIAVNENFNKLKYLNKIDEIYSDPILANSMVDSLRYEFSKLNWMQLEKEANNITGLKTAYLGSEYSHLKNISSISDFLRKTALYSDTILVADNIYSSILSSPTSDEFQIPYCFFRGIIEQSISFLALEHLFSSDSNPHICTLIPSSSFMLDAKRKETVNEIIKEDSFNYISDIFQKKLSSEEDIEKFFTSIKNFQEFISLIKKPELFLDPMGEPVSTNELQIISDQLEINQNKPVLFKTVFYQLLKMQHKYLVQRYTNLSSNQAMFSTDFKGIWKTFLWLIENSNKKLFQYHENKLPKKDEIIMQALQREDLKWLGNIPINKITALRERGELDDLRNILGKNVNEIQKASDQEFHEISQRVKYNLECALKKHSSQVNDLKEKYRSKYKLGSASIVVSGTLSFATALYPPLVAVAAAVGGGTVIKTINDFFDYRAKNEELRKKPVGMLFDVKKTI